MIRILIEFWYQNCASPNDMYSFMWIKSQPQVDCYTMITASFIVISEVNEPATIDPNIETTNQAK